MFDRETVAIMLVMAGALLSTAYVVAMVLSK